VEYFHLAQGGAEHFRPATPCFHFQFHPAEEFRHSLDLFRLLELQHFLRIPLPEEQIDIRISLRAILGVGCSANATGETQCDTLRQHNGRERIYRHAHSEIKKHREPPPGADESNDFRSEGGCQAGEQPESCALDRITKTGELVILVGEVLHTSVEPDIFRDGVATVDAEK
jgi:hypothetical protein